MSRRRPTQTDLEDILNSPLAPAAGVSKSRFRTAYDCLSSDDGISFEDAPSRTKQSFRDECDINLLMRRYAQAGFIPPPAVMPRYADVSMAQDYHSSLNMVMQAQDAFMALPAAIRSKFRNDPGEFLAFCDNPDNRAELARMGLLNPEAAKAALGAAGDAERPQRAGVASPDAEAPGGAARAPSGKA